jgi:hypothetical protein
MLLCRRLRCHRHRAAHLLRRGRHPYLRSVRPSPCTQSTSRILAHSNSVLNRPQITLNHVLCSGYTGLQLLTSIIIADITSLRWRGLVSALTTAPFILNAFVGAALSSAVLNSVGWRWGCECFSSPFTCLFLLTPSIIISFELLL